MPQRSQVALGLVQVAAVQDEIGDDGLSMEFGGNERRSRRPAQDGENGQLLSRRRKIVAKEAQQRWRTLGRMEDQTAEHIGPNLMELELEARHDAEVASAAAYSPHQLAVFMIRDVQETSAGGTQVFADNVFRG